MADVPLPPRTPPARHEYDMVRRSIAAIARSNALLLMTAPLVSELTPKPTPLSAGIRALLEDVEPPE
jgi:hypothetical protein